jgi:hypothetical protein
VQEVLAFVFGGNVLREPFRPELFSDFRTRVIASLDGISRFRFGEPGSEIDERYTWYDLKMENEKFLGQERRKIADYWHSRIEPAIQATDDAIMEHLSNWTFADFGLYKLGGLPFTEASDFGKKSPQRQGSPPMWQIIPSLDRIVQGLDGVYIPALQALSEFRQSEDIVTRSVSEGEGNGGPLSLPSRLRFGSH